MEDQERLDDFFQFLNDVCRHFETYCRRKPQSLFINSKIMQELATLNGFYGRPEVRSAEVTSYAPIVRRFRIEDTILTIYDRPDVDFLYVE